jgi:voltage-gated potassium channel
MRAAQPLPGADHKQAWLVDERFTDVLHARSLYLLLSLFFLLAAGPLINERFPKLPIFELLFTLVLLATIRRLSTSRRQARFGVVLGAPTIMSLWLSKFVADPRVSQVALILLILFLLYSTATIMFYVFSEENVTVDTLSAAFSIFLLIGFAWGCIYGLLYLDTPDAFRLPELTPGSIEFGITPGVPMGILIYFSFVTLTTVGYGDVLPVAVSARSMAMLEAVVGHFYLAILVARLVGLSIAYVGNQTAK